MQIHQLQRVHKNMKRVTVARGGKRGKTAGRGGKGQSARAGNKRRPEWRDIIKRVPKLRGRGVNQNKPVSDAFTVINIAALEVHFSAKDSVTPTTLIEKGLIATLSGSVPQVKILGEGDITKPLMVSGCAISSSALAKIEKAGGTVTLLPSRVIPKGKGPSNESDKAPIVVVKAPVKEKAKTEKPAKEPKAKK